MGNPCVVRLSSRRDPQQEAMLTILNELFSLGEWQEIAARTRFIRYDHDEGITAWLSARCRLRIIWGGDETIRQVRAIPWHPRRRRWCFRIAARWRYSTAAGWRGWIRKSGNGRWMPCSRTVPVSTSRPAPRRPPSAGWVSPTRDYAAACWKPCSPLCHRSALAMERLIHSQQNAAEQGQ